MKQVLYFILRGSNDDTLFVSESLEPGRGMMNTAVRSMRMSSKSFNSLTCRRPNWTKTAARVKLLEDFEDGLIGGVITKSASE